MIFLSLRVTADAEGGLKNRAHLRPVLQGFGGGQPPTSTPRYIPRHCLPLLPPPSSAEKASLPAVTTTPVLRREGFPA